MFFRAPCRWGYLADDELYANRGGYQIEVLMDMLRALKPL
jgi:hypothetical protein